MSDKKNLQLAHTNKGNLFVLPKSSFTSSLLLKWMFLRPYFRDWQLGLSQLTLFKCAAFLGPSRPTHSSARALIAYTTGVFVCILHCKIHASSVPVLLLFEEFSHEHTRTCVSGTEDCLRIHSLFCFLFEFIRFSRIYSTCDFNHLN